MAVVAIIAAGNMGAAVGRRLHENGCRVQTVLEGRSAASAERAKQAGLEPIGWEDVGRAEIVLSILPPDQAVGLAERLAPILRQADPKPLYADCNAVSPATAKRLGGILAPTGCAYVDAGIIGPPPAPGKRTVIYAAGPPAARLAALRDHGLDVRLVDGEIGAASALKMSYAGIGKGLQALASAMSLAASRAQAADGLAQELSESQPELLAWLRRALPGMYNKAYRWAGEMEEISEFAGEDAGAAKIYAGMAELYRRLAQDQAGERREIGQIERFLASGRD